MGFSDHAPFIDRGVPAMHFCTGITSDYHRVTDEWNRLNMEGGAMIAWMGYRTLRTAMEYPGHLDFHKTDPQNDISYMLKLVQTLGIVPNMSAQNGRYPQVAYVIPFSEAAKSGLESGDQITAINGLKFNRLEDGLNIFPQLTWEDGMRLSVLRGQDKKEIAIPASVFESLSGPKTKRLADGKYDVEFRFEAKPNVKAVYLAGEFNNWKPTALKMDGPDDKSLFTKHLQLKEGTYEYKFVIEGKDWTPNPRNLNRIGKYDNSLLWVGPRK